MRLPSSRAERALASWRWERSHTLKSAIHVVVEDSPVEMLGSALPRPKYDELLLTAIAHTATEALELCALTQPDMVVLEMLDPDRDGAEASRAIYERYPHVRVIVVVANERAGESHPCLAVRLSDGSSRGLTTAEADGLAPTDCPAASEQWAHNEHLTARELEVLACLAEGLTNHQIAVRLCISRATVKFHVSSILAKLWAPTRTAAVAVALQQQQLPGPSR